ncbi:MAG: superoxide dismutase family protein [Acidobacteriota bacterium]|nr:superoxide dismutase family protein [Acidobacteriota bacterium]
MSRTLKLMAASLVALTPALIAAQSAPAARATAALKGQGITGTVTLSEVMNAQVVHEGHDTGTRAVEITVTVRGLTPGAHGFHLHAVGKCDPDFTAAGGHLDPGPAGNTDPDANHPFHMGDLPNLVADASGTARLKATTTRVTLSDGPLSVFDADGTAFIVHGKPDQGKTGEPKSGLSGGPRVACGVIAK